MQPRNERKVGRLDYVPTRVDGVDLRRLPCSPSDAYLLSLVDGWSSVAELASAIGASTSELMRRLAQLEQHGAIRWLGESPPITFEDDASERARERDTSGVASRPRPDAFGHDPTGIRAIEPASSGAAGKEPCGKSDAEVVAEMEALFARALSVPPASPVNDTIPSPPPAPSLAPPVSEKSAAAPPPRPERADAIVARLRRALAREEAASGATSSVAPARSTSASVTPIASASVTPIASASVTPVASASVTPVASASLTPAASASVTPVASASVTRVASASVTPVASASVTPAAPAPVTRVAPPSMEPTAPASMRPAVRASVVPASVPPVASEPPKESRHVAADLAKGISQARVSLAPETISPSVRARAAASEGDLARAQQILAEALSKDPNDPLLRKEHDEIHRQRCALTADEDQASAEQAEARKQWASAAMSWKRVAEGRPRDAEARYRSARCLLHLEQFDLRSAHRLLQEATMIAPQHALARVLLAHVYVLLRMKRNAQRELEAARRYGAPDADLDMVEDELWQLGD